jgi:CheY-like chemotaxis protein
MMSTHGNRLLHLVNTDWSQSNAIKFTRAGCCARVSLRFSSESVDLIVSDCGHGMSEDFVRHKLYLPFSQQDPVASGMGLGLSLVKRNIESLGGTVDIETDQDLGTTAKISVQTENLTAKADRPKSTEGKSQIPLGVVPYMPKRSKDDLPFMHACFYAPSTWIHRYDKRDQRSIDLMFDSLSATLSEWYQPVLSLWQHETRTRPDMIFISQHNLAQFQEESGGDFADVKKVVICAAIGKNSSQDREKIRQASEVADALITGAVLPSKLWEVVTGYFPHILQPSSTPEAQGHKDKDDGNQSTSSSADEPKEVVEEDDEEHDSPSKNSHQESDESEQFSNVNNDKQGPDDQSTEQATAADSEAEQKEENVEAGANPTSEDDSTANRLSKTMTIPAVDTGKTPLKRNITVPIFQDSAQPRMLLVDDNNLNLKMLGQLVKKCGIPVQKSIAVPGGQEAIEAFKENDNSAARFDIILMDLSMPEVSGFDATSAIREIEKTSDYEHRAYIVALTGLVSDKDRNAAYEAGVDDYVTKPAGLEKVRNIIDTWQKKRDDTEGTG